MSVLIKFRFDDQDTEGDNDMGALLEKDTVNNNPTVTTYVLGTSTDGYSFFYLGVFHAFKLTGFAAGGTINGCKMEWTAAGPSIIKTADLVVGFLLDDGKWSNSDRFGTANYPKRQDNLWAEWNEGLGSDDTVYVNGSPAGTITTWAASTNNVIWDLGDGTGVGTPLMTLTGLTAHLQLAVDAVGGDDPVVALLCYRTYAGANICGPLLKSTDLNTDGPDHPQLWVDFDPPDPTSVITVVPQAQLVNGTMQITMTAVHTDYTGADAGVSATWISSLEGLISTGPNFSSQDLRVGVHTMSVISKSRSLASNQDETDYDNSPTSEGVFAGGSGYTVEDRIYMADGTVIDVTSVNSGVVDGFTTSGPSGGIIDRTLVAQVSVAPTGGTGFTMTNGPDNAVQRTGTHVFTITVYDAATDMAAAITAATVDGDPNSSLQVAGGILSAGAGGGSGEKGIAVVTGLS